MSTEGRALALAVHAGAFERVHYALVMASAAAAIGRSAVLFFTGEAVRALVDWQDLPGAEQDARLVARGVAGFEELLEACRELGVRFIACEMALRAAGLRAEELRTDLPIEVAGVVTFLEAASDGQLLFI